MQRAGMVLLSVPQGSVCWLCCREEMTKQQGSKKEGLVARPLK